MERFGIELSDNFKGKNQFLQVACIYLGLGVVVLNGINRTTSWLDQIWNNYIRNNTNSAKFPEEYAAIFVQFVERFNCDIDKIGGQLMPWVASFLPSNYARRVKDVHMHTEAVKHAETQRVGKNLSHIGLAILMTATLAGSWFIINQNSDNLNVTQRDQREDLTVLKHQYDLCIKNVQQKQSAFSKDDVFLERAIQSDIARCESIRNAYNFEADKFNESIGQGPDRSTLPDQR